MKIVKLNAINSTNTFLKDLAKDSNVKNWTVVSAEAQIAGKGQLQNKWLSEPGKNLTFSVLCRFNDFNIVNAFYLNCIVSLSIFNVLYEYIPEKLKIKWPNDILSHGKKICGILIENILSNDTVVRSVIGIGLNVNQVKFNNIPNATSLKLELNKKIDKDALLEKIVAEIKDLSNLIDAKHFKQIKINYENQLYRIHIPAMYRDIQNHHQFMGKIVGIDNFGKLLIELENESIKAFDLKEIQFI